MFLFYAKKQITWWFFDGKPAGDPGRGLGSRGGGGGGGGRRVGCHVGVCGGGLSLYCTNQWFAKRKYLQERLLRGGGREGDWRDIAH